MSEPIGVWAGGTLGKNGPIPLGSLGYIELLTAGLREKLDPPKYDYIEISMENLLNNRYFSLKMIDR